MVPSVFIVVFKNDQRLFFTVSILKLYSILLSNALLNSPRLLIAIGNNNNSNKNRCIRQLTMLCLEPSKLKEITKNTASMKDLLVIFGSGKIIKSQFQ